MIKIAPDIENVKVQLSMSRQLYFLLAAVGSMSMSRSDRAQ